MVGRPHPGSERPLHGPLQAFDLEVEAVARCVMTTLPQLELAKDQGIMNTAYRHNGNNVGVYARVLEGGRVGRGDRVVLV